MLFIKSYCFGLYAQRSGPPRTLLGSGKAAPRSFLMFSTNVCLSVCLSVCINFSDTTKQSANYLLAVNIVYM